MAFDFLFRPLTIRAVTIPNRIFSTGHQTRMVAAGAPSDDMFAYHHARAAGGAGLIIVEAARVHESALSDAPAIDASTDACVPGYRRIAEAVQGHGTKLFGQVSHSGRVNDRLRGGLRDVPYSASAVPEDRFHNMPRAMPAEMIDEVIAAYGTAAKRLAAAGLDGIEIPASHGLLPAQFLNPRVNRRSDRYGGSLSNRLRFLTEAIAAVRAGVGEERAVGVRLSVDEMELDGLEPDEVTAAAAQLAAMPELDYFNVIAGSMAGLAGSVHVVPPMMVDPAYTAPLAARLKAVTVKPVFVAGRINQPQLAEQVLEAGQADMCGMTRALIADADMPNKARAGDLDGIRACIGCNQACIGHFHTGAPISCIQNPVTGRERTFGKLVPAPTRRRVVVAGGGPAGMKAAAVAAARGHDVTLFEAAERLGGQALLAQLLPGRGEFGGLITNLATELDRAGVAVRLKTPLDPETLRFLSPDAVVIATGARPYRPAIEGEADAHVVDAWQVLRGEANVGGRVVVADWRADWVGLGIAERLARDGRHVRLAVNGTHAGQAVQSYVRDHWVGSLHRLGVEIIPYMRLRGVDADGAYFQHTASGETVICDDVETVVLALGHQAETSLEEAVAGMDVALHLAGDCLSPRSAEEAVYEGYVAATRI